MLSGVHKNNPGAVSIPKTSQGRHCSWLATPVEEESTGALFTQVSEALDLQIPWFKGWAQTVGGSQWAERRKAEDKI